MLEGKKIIIENTPGMGDLIMTTPALKRLKELYPTSELSVVSYDYNLPVIEGLPYIDHVYGIAKGKFLGHFRPALHFKEQDYVVFTSWQPQLARMAKFLGISHRAGVCKEKYRGHGLFQQELPAHDFRDKKFRADFISEQISLGLGVYLANPGICEVSPPREKDIAFVKDKLKAKGLKEGAPYAVLAPWAKTARSLPTDLVANLVKYLTENCQLSCAFLHSEPKQEIKELTAQYPHAYDLSGQTDIPQMIALLKNAKLAIVTDSGPMHVAAALETPTVAIFSTGNRTGWQPRQHCYPVTLDMNCAPCAREKAEKCPTQECIKGITAKMVREKIAMVLKK